MPDHSSNGLPENSPDNSNGNSSSGQPDSNLSAAPRIAPPEGTRAARGQYFEADEEVNEIADSQEISDSQPTSNEEITDVEEAPYAKKSYSEEELYSYDDPNYNENPGLSEPLRGEPLSAADVPDVEDSYGDNGYSPLGVGASEPYSGGKARPDTPKDVELGLMAHLGELRQRLLYCAIILMAGMTLTWNYSRPLQTWCAEPIIKTLGDKGTIISTNPTGFFSITVQFSLISALIITAPLLFWQVWLFIEPALTKAERRYSLIVVPFSSALFFTGAGLSYLVSPLFFKFFLSFQPVGIAANWDYMESIMLLAKMLLAFGVMFQVPVVVIFLNKLGLLSRNVLIEYWRHAVVLIFILAAIVTPTWDPVTLAVCATPPCLLYVLSIWLVKWL